MNLLPQLSCSWFVIIMLLGLGVAPSKALGQQVPIPVSTVSRKQPASQSLDPVLRMANNSLQHIHASVDDYTALFVKRYRIDGELTELQHANIKIRNRKTQGEKITMPMAVYLDFLQPDSVKGRACRPVLSCPNEARRALKLRCRSKLLARPCAPH